jgi:hypothetical protein
MNPMSKPFPKLFSPTALLYTYLVVTMVPRGFYSAGRIELPDGFTVFYPLGFLWIIGWWLRDDSRKQGVGWIYDMGLFLYIAWPFIMPYYLLKTRGLRGLLVTLAFVAVCVGAVILGAALYFALALFSS